MEIPDSLRTEVLEVLKDDKTNLREFCLFLFHVCSEKTQSMVVDCANNIIEKRTLDDEFVYKHKSTLTAIALHQLEINKALAVRVQNLLHVDEKLMKTLDQVLQETTALRASLLNPISWSLLVVLKCFWLVGSTIEQIYGDRAT